MTSCKDTLLQWRGQVVRHRKGKLQIKRRMCYENLPMNVKLKSGGINN